MTYKQLNFEQRYSIEAILKLKIAKRLIWQSMNISESTFYRDFKRNTRVKSYKAKYVQMLADERKK